MAGDPNWTSVPLLLHFDGANGSTSFPDSSSSPKVMTANGDAKISTAQSKFGGSALLLDGIGDFLSTPLTTTLAYLSAAGTTLECWFYLTGDAGPDGSNARLATLLSTRDGGSGGGYDVIIAGNGSITGTGIILEWVQANETNTTRSVSVSISKNAWHHLALSISTSWVKFFLDGTLLSTAAGVPADINGPASLSGKSLWIGQNLSAATWQRWFPGYIDDLRITNGVARYSADFTPPTEAYPNGRGQVSGTVTASGSPVARTIRAYRRDTGALIANTASDGAGNYSFYTPTLDEVSVLCLDDAAGTVENDLVLRATPV